MALLARLPPPNKHSEPHQQANQPDNQPTNQLTRQPANPLYRLSFVLYKPAHSIKQKKKDKKI